MGRYPVIAAAMILAAATARSQHVYETSKNSAGEVEFHSSNYGIFGLNVANADAGVRYPRGSSRVYLFGSGLWFGTQKRIQGELSPLTFITYNPISAESWAFPGARTPDPAAALPVIHNSVDHDRTTGSYTGTKQPFSWPLWIRPGETASTLNAGTFVPLNNQRSSQGGTYARPAFVSGADEQIFSRFHDGELSRYQPAEAALQGFPIGLQFQQNIFAWSQGAYASTVLIQHQIVNVSNDTLHNCVVAQVSDPDIGMGMNDHIRFFKERPELRTAYAWTDSESSGPFGVLGIALIEAPVTMTNGFLSSDEDARKVYRQMGRVGSYQTWQIEQDPATSQQRYDFLNSGIQEDAIGPMDIRTMLATSPFSMKPGDTAYFTIAYIIADQRPDPTAPAGQSMLERVITSITEDYYEGAFSSAASVPAVSGMDRGISLAAVPNPAKGHLVLRTTFDMPSSESRIRITNTLGETVMLRHLDAHPAGPHDERIDVAELPAGVYIATVESGGRRGTVRLTIVN